MTNTFNTKIDSLLALESALREAGLDTAADCAEKYENGYWVVEFTACELRYTCYVDAETGDVPGLSFEPVPVKSYAAESFVPGRAVTAA